MIMYALTTTEGVAMPETGVCEEHAPGAWHIIESAAIQAGDWDGDEAMHDVTGNDQIFCVECGKPRKYPRILREYLGGSEELDLMEPDDWDEWEEIICDYDMAIHYAERIMEEGEVVVNENDAVFIERYTRLG